jgi:hypothetical protein
MTKGSDSGYGPRQRGTSEDRILGGGGEGCILGYLDVNSNISANFNFYLKQLQDINQRGWEMCFHGRIAYKNCCGNVPHSAGIVKIRLYLFRYIKQTSSVLKIRLHQFRCFKQISNVTFFI